MVGNVLEVFIPNDNINMIGFRIQLEDEVLELIDKQDNINSRVYRNDKVLLSLENGIYKIEEILDEE